jgi:hypothetical protein
MLTISLLEVMQGAQTSMYLKLTRGWFLIKLCLVLSLTELGRLLLYSSKLLFANFAWFSCSNMSWLRLNVSLREAEQYGEAEK